MMNSVHSLPMDFTNGINSVGNSIGKNDTSSFFFCFFFLIFFSHCNSLGIYRGNISVGKIPRKFNNENIPSVFSFVFINFLVVIVLEISTFISYYFEHQLRVKSNRVSRYDDSGEVHLNENLSIVSNLG